MSDKAAHKEEAPAADAPAKGGMMGQLKVGGIIATIVLIQCMMAYFLLPSAPTEAAAAPGAHKKDASKKHGDDHGEHAKGEHGKDEHGKEGDHHAAPESGEQREADLGKFSITSYDQASNSTILIDFHLYGAVFEEEKHEGDAAAADAHGGGHGGHGDSKKAGEEEDTSKFGKLFKKNKHRFRDQVITIVRNSDPAARSDPALGLLKRQILAKTNSLLGEPLLKEVIFSEFSVVQQ